MKMTELPLALILIAVSSGASADITTETVRDIVIYDASLKAESDGTYRLLFRVSNDSPETVTLVGLASSAAGQADLIYRSHHGQEEPVQTLTLRPDEEVDFSTSHLIARLSGVFDDLEVIPFNLSFREGVVGGEAHVH